MRNWLVIALVIVVIVALLNLLATVIGSLLPIAVTAVIAFLLGRLSTRTNFADAVRKATEARRTEPARTVTATATKPAEAQRAPVAEKSAPEEALPQQELKNPDLLLDPNFEIKTPEQIEAEARQRESEMMQQAKAPAATDVQAALEARRKRLLENK